MLVSINSASSVQSQTNQSPVTTVSPVSPFPQASASPVISQSPITSPTFTNYVTTSADYLLADTCVCLMLQPENCQGDPFTLVKAAVL